MELFWCVKLEFVPEHMWLFFKPMPFQWQSPYQVSTDTFFFIWTGNVHIYTFWTHFTYDITRKVVQASPPPPFLFVSCLLVDPWTLGSFSGRCLVWEGCVGVYDDQNPTLPGQRSQGSRWNTLCTCMQADAGTFNTNETMVFERNRGRKHEIKIRRFVGCL